MVLVPSLNNKWFGAHLVGPCTKSWSGAFFTGEVFLLLLQAQLHAEPIVQEEVGEGTDHHP